MLVSILYLCVAVLASSNDTDDGSCRALLGLKISREVSKGILHQDGSHR